MSRSGFARGVATCQSWLTFWLLPSPVAARVPDTCLSRLQVPARVSDTCWRWLGPQGAAVAGVPGRALFLQARATGACLCLQPQRGLPSFLATLRLRRCRQHSQGKGLCYLVQYLLPCAVPATYNQLLV